MKMLSKKPYVLKKNMAKVTVITMGPPQAEAILRDALAMALMMLF